MISQSDAFNQAAIDALKQSPSVIASLFLIVWFIRYISGRDRSDQEERQKARESHEKLADSVNNLALVVEGIKEKLKK